MTVWMDARGAVAHGGHVELNLQQGEGHHEGRLHLAITRTAATSPCKAGIPKNLHSIPIFCCTLKHQSTSK